VTETTPDNTDMPVSEENSEGAAPAKRPRGRPRKPRNPEADPTVDMPSILPIELAKQLESGIIFGELSPGERVVEDDVAIRFNVSRSPVRDAFRHLEANGLVVREARRGVRVTEMSLRDLDEVYSCRIELEGLATQQAAINCTSAQVGSLDRHFEKMLRAGASGDMRAYFWTNIEFTENVQEIAANRTLSRILAGLGRQAMRYRYYAYKRFPGMIEWSMNTNRELIAAVKENAPDRARETARLIVGNAWAKIRSALEDDGKRANN
jgi:DNA-binding GntR family transcriptional regulator